MSQNTPLSAQAKKSVALPAETLQAIKKAVFLHNDVPAITLQSVDQLHRRQPETTAHALRRRKEGLALESDYTLAVLPGQLDRFPLGASTGSEPNKYPEIWADKFFGSKGERGGYRGEMPLLYRDGYLAVTDSLSGDLDLLIREAVIAAFERLEREQPTRANAALSVIFAYNGISIHVDNNGMFDAKEIYKAVGAPKSRSLYYFLKTTQAPELSPPEDKLSPNFSPLEGVKSRKSQHLPNIKGYRGSAWMSPKLAILYAAYLSAPFCSCIVDACDITWAQGKLVSATEDASKAVSESAPESVAPALDAELLSARVVERVVETMRQEARENRQEFAALRERIARDMTAVRQGLTGEISATRDEVSAARDALSGQMAWQFSKAEAANLENFQTKTAKILHQEARVDQLRTDALCERFAEELSFLHAGLKGEIDGAHNSLSDQIVELFDKAEDFHRAQQKFLFFCLQREINEIIDNLAQAFRADARDLFKEAQELASRKFEEFQREHFGAASAKNQPRSEPPASVHLQIARAPRPIVSEKIETAPSWQPLLLLIAWWECFGGAKKRAGQIASLRGGALVAGGTPLSKSMRFSHWARNAMGTVFPLSDSLEVQLRGESASPGKDGIRVYWLERLNKINLVQ